jgi:hypothetical protein
MGAGRALGRPEVWMRYLLLALLVMACGSEPAAPVAEAAVVAAKPELRAEPVAAPVVPMAAPVVVADGKVGVAACDEYLEAYRGCIDSLERGFQEPHRKVVEQLAASWRIARADEKVAGTLEGTCGSTRAASKLSLPSCKW